MNKLLVSATIQRIITLTLFVCALALGGAPSLTQAFFIDNATANASSFAAGIVSFDTNPTLAATVMQTGSTNANFSITDTGTIAANYHLAATPLICNPNFYQGLEASLNSAAVLYSGLLSGLTASSTTAGAFSIALSASSSLGALANETCTIALTVNAWQGLFPSNLYGFSDTETIIVTITADENIGVIIPPLAPLPTSGVVLNEIYPSILATTTIPLEREWIELYNGTAAAIDVAGWSLGEFVGGNIANAERIHKIVSSCTGLPASTHVQPLGGGSTIIPAGGYLVIDFCGAAEYLGNSGDTIKLYDSNGTTTLIDSHSYGVTANGKSHARIPDGGTWVDPLPTPGAFNVATEADLLAEGWSLADILEIADTGAVIIESSIYLPILLGPSSSQVITTIVNDINQATTSNPVASTSVSVTGSTSLIIIDEPASTTDSEITPSPLTCTDNCNETETGSSNSVLSNTKFKEPEKFDNVIEDALHSEPAGIETQLLETDEEEIVPHQSGDTADSDTGNSETI